MAEREAIYKLKFLVDKSGQQESVRAIDTLAKEFSHLDENAQAVSKSAQAAIAHLSAFNEGRAELHATADAAKEAAIDADGLGDALGRAADASTDMEKVQREVRAAREELQKAAIDANDLGSRLDQADERFDVVSRRSGLGGDTGTGLSTVGSVLQTAGAGKAGQIAGVAGEFAELTETIPRLKVALQNLPDVARFAASEIGASGVGLIGALAVLALAFKELSEQAQKNRNEVKGAIDDQREFNDFLSTATKQSVDERIAELQRQAEAEQKTLDTARRVRDEFNAAVDEAYGENSVKVLRGIDNVTGAFGTFDETAKQVEKSKDIIKTTERQIAELSKAYDDQGVIARTLAEDEKRLAAERRANDAEYISFIEERNRRLVEAEKLLATGTEEQVQARIDAIEQEKEINRRNIADLTQGMSIADFFADAQLDPAIRASVEGYIQAISDAEEEQNLLTGSTQGLVKSQSALTSALTHQDNVIKERIAQLKEQAQSELEFTRFLKSASAESVQARIEGLQEEAAALRSILPELERLAPTSAEAAREFANTTDRLSEIDAELKKIGSQGVIAAIRREQEQLTEEIIKIEAARDEKIAQIRAQAAEKELALFQDLQRGLAEALADAAEERADAQRDYIQESTDIEAELAKKRLDIQKKFGRSLEQAIDDRDALAANQARQARDDELEDAEDSAQEQRRTLQEEYQRQLETIDRELTKQQQTLQAKYNQQLSDLRTQTANSINLERQKAQEEINTRQQAYQQELALLQTFAQSGASTIATFTQSSASSLVQFSSEAQTILAGFVSQANSIMRGLISSGGAPTTPPPPSPIGGPQQPFAGGGGGVNIKIEGYTIPQIHAELNAVLKHLIN